MNKRLNFRIQLPKKKEWKIKKKESGPFKITSTNFSIITVCRWIIDAVAAVQVQMFKGVVKRVVFVIFSNQHEVLERFLFDVDRFPVVPEKETYAEFAREGVVEVAVNAVDVEEQLRATIARLANCGGKLGPLPADCTYTLVMELKDEALPPIGVGSSLQLIDFGLK
jgi:hypothetical protein